MAAGGPVALLCAASGGGSPTSRAFALAVLGPVAALLIRRLSPPVSTSGRLLIGALVGLAALSAISYLWSTDRPATVQAALLAAAIAAGVATILAAAAGRGSWGVVVGTAAAISLIDLYSLSTRLLPSIMGSGGRHPGFNRLYEPIGYWNGLGALTAIGILLTLGVVADGIRPLRMAGCAALVVQAPVLYLTFSRGSVAALVIGFVVALALERRRLRFAACSAVAVVAPLLAVLAVYLRPALTSAVPHGSTTAEGAEAGLAVVLLCLAAARAGGWLDRRLTTLHPTPQQRRRAVWGLTGLVLAPLVVALILGGGPVDLAKDSFGTAGAPAPTFRHGNLNLRYLSLSANGRTRIWRAALHQFVHHSLVGDGAGSFPRYWLRVRAGRPPVVQAHSIELTTLAELGIGGGLLLAVALVVPALVAVRTRRDVLVPVLAGAYSAFLLATAVDWTWQLAGVTLAGLACAAALVGGDPRGLRGPSPRERRIALAVGGLACLAGLVLYAGNLELSRAQNALAAGRYGAARREASRAATLQPWAAEPWLVAGYANVGLGDKAAAARDAHKAVSADDGDARAWVATACLNRGRDRRAAIARARALDPAARAFLHTPMRCLPPRVALSRAD